MSPGFHLVTDHGQLKRLDEEITPSELLERVRRLEALVAALIASPAGQCAAVNSAVADVGRTG